MRTAKLSAILILCASVLLVNGCSSELENLRIQNDAQQKRIDELLAELSSKTLELDQLKRQLATAQGMSNVDLETLQKQIAALEEDIAKKNQLIASMQQRLLAGGAVRSEEHT